MINDSSQMYQQSYGTITRLLFRENISSGTVVPIYYVGKV